MRHLDTTLWPGILNASHICVCHQLHLWQMQQFHRQKADMRTILGGLQFWSFGLQFWSTSPTQTPQLQQNTQPWLGAAGCWILCVSKGAKRWGGSYLVVVQSIISSIATTWSNVSDQKSKSRQTSNKCWCEAPLTDHNTYSITWFILL